MFVYLVFRNMTFYGYFRFHVPCLSFEHCTIQHILNVPRLQSAFGDLFFFLLFIFGIFHFVLLNIVWCKYGMVLGQWARTFEDDDFEQIVVFSEKSAVMTSYHHYHRNILRVFWSWDHFFCTKDQTNEKQNSKPNNIKLVTWHYLFILKLGKSSDCYEHENWIRHSNWN